MPPFLHPFFLVFRSLLLFWTPLVVKCCCPIPHLCPDLYSREQTSRAVCQAPNKTWAFNTKALHTVNKRLLRKQCNKSHWSLHHLSASLLFNLFSSFLADQKESPTELAFKYAVFRINKDKDVLPNNSLTYDIQYVPNEDSFRTTKKVGGVLLDVMSHVLYCVIWYLIDVIRSVTKSNMAY